VITSHYAEVAAGVGKLALLNVLDPGAKYAKRYPVFFFARHSAGVTANTSVLVDNESVSHGANFTLYLSLRRADDVTA
jgi:hypothetical protein